MCWNVGQGVEWSRRLRLEAVLLVAVLLAACGVCCLLRVACAACGVWRVGCEQADEERVFEFAAGQLRAMGLELLDTGVTLTVRGDLQEAYADNSPHHLVRACVLCA